LKQRRKMRRKRPSPQNEEEEEDDDDDDDDDDEEEEEVEEESRWARDMDEGQGDAADTFARNTEHGTPILALAPPHFDIEVKAGDIAFFNMKGDPTQEARQKYPVVPVYIGSVNAENKLFTIYWYTTNWNGKLPPGFADGTVRKTVVFEKFWTKPDWMKLENIKSKSDPSFGEKVMEYWAKQENVPQMYLVPFQVHSADFKEKDPCLTDKLTFPMEWYKDKLIPKLTELNIVN